VTWHTDVGYTGKSRLSGAAYTGESGLPGIGYTGESRLIGVAYTGEVPLWLNNTTKIWQNLKSSYSTSFKTRRIWLMKKVKIIS
jgi:hypothetical protein